MTSFDEKILNVVSDIAASTNNPFKDKYVSILGDSISTYEGYIPEGLIANEHKGFDTVDKEWWHILLSKLDAKLCVNYSCSGMRISGTDSILSAAYKHYASQLHREADKEYINLDGSKSTFEEVINPDVILIMLGTNDYQNNAIFSDFTHADLSTQQKTNAELTDNTLFTDVKTAYERILYDIITTYQNATVYCITAPPSKNGQGYPFPNSAGWAIPLLDRLIDDLCVKYSCKHISLFNLGIRAINAYVGSDKFLLSDKIHPTTEGHKLIAKECYRVMISDNVSWGTRNDIN